MAGEEGSLSSLWSYDSQQTYEPAPKRPKPNLCLLCVKKQNKLEKEQAANIELVRSIASLTRSRAECLRELEELRDKLRSLEHGGGVPQPAPPEPGLYGSGGGVAARAATPSPSPALPFSAPTRGLHGEEVDGVAQLSARVSDGDSGPAAAAPQASTLARAETEMTAAVAAAAIMIQAAKDAREQAEAAASAARDAIAVVLQASRKAMPDAASTAAVAPDSLAASSARSSGDGTSTSSVEAASAARARAAIAAVVEATRKGKPVAAATAPESLMASGERSCSRTGNSMSAEAAASAARAAVAVVLNASSAGSCIGSGTSISTYGLQERCGGSGGRGSCGVGWSVNRARLPSSAAAMAVGIGPKRVELSKLIDPAHVVPPNSLRRRTECSGNVTSSTLAAKFWQQMLRKTGRQQGRQNPQVPLPLSQHAARAAVLPPTPKEASPPESSCRRSSSSSSISSSSSSSSSFGVPSRRSPATSRLSSAPATLATSPTPSSSPPSFRTSSSAPQPRHLQRRTEGGRANTPATAIAPGSNKSAVDRASDAAGRWPVLISSGKEAGNDNGTTTSSALRTPKKAATTSQEGGGAGAPGASPLPGEATLASEKGRATGTSAESPPPEEPVTGFGKRAVVGASAPSATGQEREMTGASAPSPLPEEPETDLEKGGAASPSALSATALEEEDAGAPAASPVLDETANTSERREAAAISTAAAATADRRNRDDSSTTAVTAAEVTGGGLVAASADATRGEGGSVRAEEGAGISTPDSASLSMSPGASSIVSVSSPAGGKRVPGERERGEDEDGTTPTHRTLGDSTCLVRHMHVLGCFLCGHFPTQPTDCRAVVFCAKCPRKACLSCQESKVSKDRKGWVEGQDMFGRYYEIPACRECQGGADDEVPEWVQPPLEIGEGYKISEISEGDTRILLDRFLRFLQDHELAHFFADDVDPEEYPEYRKIVKNPMNFSRMRQRLEAGVYYSRRAGLNSFMEDVDWIRHNCIMFNGDRAAISRCAELLSRRANKYYDTHVTPVVNILRRPGSEGAHRAPAFSSKKRGNTGAGNGAAPGGQGGAGEKHGASRRKRQQVSTSQPRIMDGGTSSFSSSSSSSGMDSLWVRRETTPPPMPPTPYTSSSSSSSSSSSLELPSFWGGRDGRGCSGGGGHQKENQDGEGGLGGEKVGDDDLWFGPRPPLSKVATTTAKTAPEGAVGVVTVASATLGAVVTVVGAPQSPESALVCPAVQNSA